MQSLKDPYYSITVANIVDITIMAVMVHFILAWVTWTRAVQILVTLMAMGLFYFAASQSALVLTSLLFQNLWAAIIIVLIIIFQPEIRAMMDRAAPVRLWGMILEKPLKAELIQEVLRAADDLARRRTGALLVFRRVDALDNLMVQGNLLDGLLSSEAIIMIFQKGSPLHDGAILIEEDRIKAASCILPLSTDTDLSSRYGTRHRAALGLSERSDALCVVISEERGEVSLVENQTIVNYKNPERFRRALERGLMFGKTQSRTGLPSIRDILTGNWRLRILSLATAVLLWFVIVGPQKAELGMSVPIQYSNLSQGMELTGKWMDRLDVRVRGSESGLAGLKPGSVRAFVDLGQVVSGLNYFRISGKNIQVPPGISIVKIRPSDLQLNIEAASAKMVRVITITDGTLPENVKISVIPAEVRVKALEADLKKVKGVTTETFSVPELLKKGKMIVPVVVQPDGLRIDSVGPERVTISVEQITQ